MKRAGAAGLMTGAVVEEDIDIVRAEIVRNALLSAAQEMNDTLVRSAYNPLIFDVKDFGVGIMSAAGELWADAPGLPIFTGVLPATVRSALRKFGPTGLMDGDVLITNSPYLNGTHLSDTAVYMPTFYNRELVAFVGSMAHWGDIGGMSPGGWTVNSTEIVQEGISFTHQRLFVGGLSNRDILEQVAANVRIPGIVVGDLYAQIATCRTGAERVVALCERYGSAEVAKVMQYIIQRTERSLRQEVAALPDGRYHSSVRMDFNGVDPEEIPVVAVTTTIEGDRIRVSFEGTSRVSAGPINCGAEATISAVAEGLKGILDPVGPANEAHIALAEIEWGDEPTLLNAVAPAPCDSYGYVLTALLEVMQLALIDAVPERTRAGSYQMWAEYIMATSTKTAKPYVFCEPVQGGHGAFPGHDGGCMIFLLDGNVSNEPVEVLEMRYPVLCEQFAFNPESAGAGEFRGGFGVKRDLRVMAEHSMIKTALENTVDALSRGAKGGHAGSASYARLVFPDGRTELQHQRISDTAVPVGFVLEIRTGGGGGFGFPLDRDPQRVAEDVRDEFLTPEQAASLYGVRVVPGRIKGSWAADSRHTESMRAAMRAE